MRSTAIVLAALLVIGFSVGCSGAPVVHQSGALGPVYSPMLQGDWGSDGSGGDTSGGDWGGGGTSGDTGGTAGADTSGADTAGADTSGAGDTIAPDTGEPKAYARPKGDIRSSIKGIPPLYWYRSGDNAEIVVPPMLSYYSDDLVLGLLGIVNIGIRDREWVDEETGKKGIAVYDWNFLGLYRTAEYFYIEDGQLKRDSNTYLLWLIPLGGADGEPVDQPDATPADIQE